MSNEIDTAVDVTRETLEETPGRTLTFLRGVGTDLAIFAALGERGYTKKVHGEGWGLVHRASGFVDGGVAAVDGFNEAAQAAIKTLDSWDEDGLRLTGATLRNRYPAQAAFVLAGLAPSTGMQAVSNVKILLDRLDALESGEDRKATRAADQAAIAKLAERGLHAEERARLRGLVNTATALGKIDADAPKDTAAREAEYLEALKALRVWYVEWADVARVAIKRRDRLIRLGLAKRKPRKEEEEGEGGPNKT
jgi:hypothetical protein